MSNRFPLVDALGKGGQCGDCVKDEDDQQAGGKPEEGAVSHGEGTAQLCDLLGRVRGLPEWDAAYQGTDDHGRGDDDGGGGDAGGYFRGFPPLTRRRR